MNSRSPAQRARREKALAHTLLVELLAHQFCFPVKWTDTQDLIFGQRKISRAVEIGPGDTLTNISKRTIQQKYQRHDAVNSIKRQFLCYKRDAKDIYYEHDASSRTEKAAAPPSSTPTESPSQPEQAPVAAAPQPAVQSTAASIPDAPVKAVDIVKVIVATGLKKSAKEISIEDTIKGLSGGRSTLQNEIIGDLDKEFGSVPDKAEDISLKDLSSSVQNSFGGKLGKKSMSLIDRMISSKMPSSFKIGALRTYLKGKYGLANGHQDGILISAVAAQPDAGLKDDGAAKSFWDGIVQSYLQANGITLQHGATSAGTGAQQSTMIDPETLKMLQKGPTEHYQLQLQLYAKQLGVDLDAGNKVEGAFKDAINVLQKDLNLWNEEHGHAYAEGIKPFFDPLKHRRYDSYWNWVLQDLYILFYGILNGSVKVTDTETIDRRARLINRSTPRLVKTMGFLRNSLSSRHGKNIAAAKVLLSQLIADCEKSLDQAPVAIMAQNLTGPRTIIDREGNIKYEEVLRPLVYKSKKEKRRHEHIVTIQEYDSGVGSASSDNDDFSDSEFDSPGENSPHLGYDRLSRRTGNRSWQIAVKTATISGVSFHKKNVLLTGAGKGSIGAEILKGLLAGGANVLVTTNSYSPEVTRRFQDLYAKYGARGSQLVVVPFNQGSQQDVEALVNWIYDKNGLGWDLDHVIPFAAISENGRQIDRIDSRSELAHRLMLTNTLRLLGAIKRQKAEANIITRPAHVLLPMSPNHGIFGNDGLYAESKLGLHSLLNKWHSENWQDYLLICGVTIGWTRGTALMNDNDIVAEGIEKLGIKTYSQEEMAFNILGLMSPAAVAITQTEPLLADLSGGMDQVADLKAETDRIRQQIYSTSEVRRALAQDVSEMRSVHQKHIAAPVLEQRANIQLDFPRLPDYQTEIEAIRSRGKPLVDLDSVVVIAGFAELGPYGNARTRWQMEAYGKFSLEGCVELAWMMGLIKPNRDGKVKEDGSHAGWVDAKTGIPVSDMEVKQKYEPYILDHTGLRFIEPRSHEEPDITSRRVLHEVEIQEDMPPFEVSKETAEELKREHKGNVEISAIADSEDRVQVVLKKGARLHIPKALDFNRFVAGQIPTGWDPRAYGIPDDIINQVDPATLYPLVCTIEAFISAGITDPYELYKYIHVTEVGNCLGSGMGGATSLQRIFKERLLDKPVANDILAESFINSAAAWVNMLLLSAAGPIHTPVGACATAVESLTLGHELITSGKAKAVLVGGYDDLIRDMAFEFAQMKATNNVVDDLAHGRSPKEMSRPATSTRQGFVESEGCGIQIVTSARLALDMGLPIHGIVALAQTNSDRTGRSLPAPGKGVLTNAAQLNSKIMSPLMNRDYRQRNVELRLRQISEVEAREMQILEEEITMLKSGGEAVEDEYVRQRRADITTEAHRQKRHALHHYGNGFWKQDTRISPISGSLAVWGLTVDDLDVASFHGTSTKLNEKNECSVVQKQLSHLGRTQGNEIFGVFQKHLTGHPKGAAGAWMLNGCLQIMNTGLIPGNRNADNIDQALEPFDYICFPSQTIQKTDEAGGVKAFSVTSFGFGQKGSQVIGVNPKYLYAALEEQDYAAYSRKVEQRQQAAYRYFHQAIAGGKMFVPKDKAPFADEREVEFFLNPELRVG